MFRNHGCEKLPQGWALKAANMMRGTDPSHLPVDIGMGWGSSHLWVHPLFNGRNVPHGTPGLGIQADLEKWFQGVGRIMKHMRFA